MLDIAQLITAVPNLAAVILVLWFYQQVQKERAAENARYASSLEEINKLYVALLEKAVTAIANNATLSTRNGDSIAKLLEQIAALRSEMGGLRDAVERLIRDSKRGQPDRRATQGGAGTD